MGKSKKALSATDDVEDINISPLIDMVFILLIFFIVTTVFVEEPGIDVVKPMAFNAQDLPKNCILIGVTASDNVFYGGEEVGLNGIRVKVRRLIRAESPVPTSARHWRSKASTSAWAMAFVSPFWLEMASTRTWD